MIIGISGKSGSGKSFISKCLAEKLHYKRIDLDKLSKEIRDKYQDEIVNLIGDSSILVDNCIDSKKLGVILFGNKELLDRYNEFIYLKQKQSIEEFLQEEKNVIIDSMFLPIMEVFNFCDYKVLIVCDEKMRRKRILSRDKISEEYLNKRERHALKYDEKNFDIIIDTSFDYKKGLDLLLEKIILE